MTLADIAVIDPAVTQMMEVQKQEEAKNKAKTERLRSIKEIRKSRKLVGTASDVAGVRYVAAGLVDVYCVDLRKTKGYIEVWASYGFVACTCNPNDIEWLISTRGCNYETVNIEERPGQGDVMIYVIWGSLL